MSVAQLSYEINLLSAAKVRFANIANQLGNAALALEPIGGRISSMYTVDDNSTPISLRSNEVRSKLIQLANIITGTVLPAIDRQIIAKRQVLIYEAQMG